MSRVPDEVGRVVYLLGALAETSFDIAVRDQPRPCSLIGLFSVEEFQPFEPSAYAWSPGYLVAPFIDEDDWPMNCRYCGAPARDGDLNCHSCREWIAPAGFDMMYFIGIDEYEAQVNPSQYAASLAMERDMANAEEREYS